MLVLITDNNDVMNTIWCNNPTTQGSHSREGFMIKSFPDNGIIYIIVKMFLNKSVGNIQLVSTVDNK